MLVALARKLAIALWRYVETALVPDGIVCDYDCAPHPSAANLRPKPEAGQRIVEAWIGVHSSDKSVSPFPRPPAVQA